ncbi:MAG: hypothetical protein PVF17_00655 [Ignavibacteria bacterium]|jgi:hypothetical protein
MVQIIPQDVPLGSRLAHAALPQIGEGFGQGFSKTAETLMRRQIEADYANKAANMLIKNDPEMAQYANLLRATGMTGNPFDVSRLLPLMMRQRSLPNEQPAPQPSPPPNQGAATDQAPPSPQYEYSQSGLFTGNRTAPERQYQKPAQYPVATQQQPQNAQSQFQLQDQGGLTPEQYRRGVPLAPDIVNQQQQEARTRLSDPTLEIQAEQARDDQLLSEFDDYFADQGIGQDSRDKNTFLNMYKQDYANANIPLSQKKRLAEQSFSHYIKARNTLSNALQRDLAVQNTGNIPTNKIDSYRNTARLMMKYGDQENLYEIANESGLTPISAEDLINPLRSSYSTMKDSVDKLNVGKYKRIGIDANERGKFLREQDKAVESLSNYLQENLQGSDSLLLIAEKWKNEHGGSLNAFRQAVNDGVKNGLELSSYQQSQLNQLAENPFLNRLYETGSYRKAFLGR